MFCIVDSPGISPNLTACGKTGDDSVIEQYIIQIVCIIFFWSLTHLSFK